MWHLKMSKSPDQWTEAGSFETVTAAGAQIRKLEGYPVAGVFLTMHVDTGAGTDAEAFGHLEHTGRLALYVVKRVEH